MNPTVLTIVATLLGAMVLVIAYNMYQENQYRKRIRNQFGHADKDALMDTQTSSVRDGEMFGHESVRPLRHEEKLPEDIFSPFPPSLNEPEIKLPEEPKITLETPLNTPTEEISAPLVQASEEKNSAPLETLDTVSAQSSEPASDDERLKFELLSTANAGISKNLFRQLGKDKDRLAEILDTLSRSELRWFHKRFDFMAYVALKQEKELQAIPCLSTTHPFQMIGYTADGRFQAAEPIPDVMYQAFVIGLQGITRQGMVSLSDLQYFSEQVEMFADKMDARVHIEDAPAFLAQVAELDELCARVDQVIVIHLVSRMGISGAALRETLARHGFALQSNGSFAHTLADGETQYQVLPLDNGQFTEMALESQTYSGFSMQFDITRIPNAAHHFNHFMSLVVKISGDLDLDLVDSERQPLSTEWLKKVRTYVSVLQQEMQEAGIEAGGSLAKRVFA